MKRTLLLQSLALLLCHLTVFAQGSELNIRNASATGEQHKQTVASYEAAAQEDTPNVTFTIISDLGTDEDGYDIDECDFYMMLRGNKDDVISIDTGWGKEDYTFPSDEPVSITKTLDAGATVKIYGDFYMLDLSGNRKVTSISFTEIPSLEILRLSQNKIAELNVDCLTSLKELSFTDNKVAEIDISKLSALEEYYGAWNYYTTLNTEHNPNLKVLTCYNTGISSLHLQNNTALQVLTAGGNKYTEQLVLDNNTALNMIDLEDANFEMLDLSKLSLLRKLNLYGNEFKALDITSNPDLQYVDLRSNKMDACAINDVLFSLPVVSAENVEEAPKVMIARNPGAENAETDITDLFGWTVDQAGNGEGCQTVRLKIEESENGSLTTKVGDKEYASMEPIEKGSTVDIISAPAEGYELGQIFFNGEAVADNQLVASKYGILAAVFTVHNAIHSNITGSVQVKNAAGTVSVTGLNPGSQYTLYNTSGTLLERGIVTTDGKVVIKAGHGVYILKSDNVIVKISK